MANPLWKGSEVIAALSAHLADAVRADWQADGVAIDTRDLRNGDIFVALSGARADGHDFVATAFEAGAVAALVRSDFAADNLPAHAVLLRVADVLAALEALGRAARERCTAHVSAITGSVGKTSTKEALAHALSKSGTVHAAEKSFNNHIGVPLTLARMSADVDYAVFELGMNHAGEIAALVDMVRPHSAMITAIGAAHIENFASMDELARAKAEIIGGVVEDGVVILPRDSAYFDVLRGCAENTRVVEVSAEGNDTAQAFVMRSKLHATCSCVTAQILGQEVTYKIGMAGAHHIANSLAVLACVCEAGADLALAALSLADNEGFSGRGRRHIIGHGDATFTLIDESYNANPTSMAAALMALGLAPRQGRGRRIAVLGDMAELGTDAARLHAALAENIEAADIDLVITCGALMAHLHDLLPPMRTGSHVTTHDEVVDVLRRDVRADDVVMVKASNAMGLSHVVSALLATAQPTHINERAG